MKPLARTLAASAALAAAGLEAATVIRYTFDSGSVGDVIANGATVVNAANPGVHDATHEYDLAGNYFPLAMKAGKVQAVLPLSNGLHDGRDD